MRGVLTILLSATIAGCSGGVGALDAPQSEALHDVTGYAIASCLAYQENAYLKDQGDAWASVIVQRSHGSIELLTDVAEVVKQETEKGGMTVMRDEEGGDKALPLLYCHEIIDRPAVRDAIEKSVTSLTSS